MQPLPSPPDASEEVRPSERQSSARQRQEAREQRRQRHRPVAQRRRQQPASWTERAQDWGAQIGATLQDLPGAFVDFTTHMTLGKGIFIGVVLIMLVLLFTAGAIYTAGAVLPGVSVAGVQVSGLSEAEVVIALREAWAERSLMLRDGERTWDVPLADLGFSIDAVASARQAVRYGREQGGLTAFLGALLSGVDLVPVVEADMDAAYDGLVQWAEVVAIAPHNATLRLQGVVVTHLAPQDGRRLRINELWAFLGVNPAQIVEDGVIDLPMETVSPAIIDASPLVEYAQSLLRHPLVLEAYDPVADRSHPMVVAPEEWGQWLDTQVVYYPTGPRMYLSLAGEPLVTYLEEQAERLPAPLTLDIGDGVRAMREAVANGSLNNWVTVRYEPTVYTVQRGETAYLISRTEGIPFYFIQEANPDIDLENLYPGDEIVLPSRDAMLPLRPVRGKRIVVDLSDQYMWAYENGEVVFEWAISSGIASAPTSSGVFQILSHVDVAYGSSFTLCNDEGLDCGQWAMHWFMGVYEIQPGLMNGFHGAVELPDGRYLGGGNVGHPYTFGCIMALEDNALELYNWAEEGVVVEIRQ
ncbi:MAG: L,D-transpeptidase family protein [Anaerolineae bacterium]|nr:L,D-transpeptidase family protein [Anaerolineae bacterium]